MPHPPSPSGTTPPQGHSQRWRLVIGAWAVMVCWGLLHGWRANVCREVPFDDVTLGGLPLVRDLPNLFARPPLATTVGSLYIVDSGGGTATRYLRYLTATEQCDCFVLMGAGRDHGLGEGGLDRRCSPYLGRRRIDCGRSWKPGIEMLPGSAGYSRVGKVPRVSGEVGILR